jgi:hypothetical protein
MLQISYTTVFRVKRLNNITLPTTDAVSKTLKYTWDVWKRTRVVFLAFSCNLWINHLITAVLNGTGRVILFNRLTAWIRIMCPSEVTCLPANSSLSELPLFFKVHLSVLRSSTKGLSLSHISVTYFRHDMAKNAWDKHANHHTTDAVSKTLKYTWDVWKRTRVVFLAFSCNLWINHLITTVLNGTGT